MLKAGIIIFLFVFGVIIENIRELSSFRTVIYEITSSKLKGIKKKKRMVFLSDLHNYNYGSENDKLLKAIKRSNPDLILIGGDMLVRKDGCSYKETLKTLSKLPEICPVYYANGNHEQKLKELPEQYKQSYKDYRNSLMQMGIHFLENTSKEIFLDDMQFRITGLEIPLYGYARFGKRSLSVEEITTRIGDSKNSENIFEILLAHNPMYMKEYFAWGADLILSGHLHGGVIRLPFLGGVVAPNFQLFPKYSGGIYREKKQTAVVSSGLGSHSIPIRLWNHAELVVLELSMDKTCEKMENPV